MSDSKLERTLTGAGVTIECSSWGTLTATLRAYREKQGGGYEEIIIRFPDLDPGSVACIGRSAVNALRDRRKAVDKRAENDLTFVTGWVEGNGPSSG